MDKYDWGASESAPEEYPMEIVTGTLVYKGQNSGLYVPNRVTLFNKLWGRGRSTHVTGPEFKPLPGRLEIKFFSYAENQFYVGNFELPYDTILGLFRKGYYSPDADSRWVLRNDDEYRKRHRKMGLADDRSPYSEMLVGVTPGGGVAVWVSGVGAQTEVFFGQAEKADLDWKLILDNPNVSREESVRGTMQYYLKHLTPKALAALQAANGVIPFDRWQGYRARYPWHPHFTGMKVRESEGIYFQFFNGEIFTIDYPVTGADLAQTRVVPSVMSFIWMQSETTSVSFGIDFDEAEIFAAFTELGSQQPLQLEMRMEPPPAGATGEAGAGQKPYFSIWLRNSSEARRLKKSVISNSKRHYSKEHPDGKTGPLGDPLYVHLP